MKKILPAAFALASMACMPSENKSVETIYNTVSEKTSEVKTYPKMTDEEKKECREKAGYSLVPITYNYPYKGAELYMSGPARPADDAENWRILQRGKPTEAEKTRAVWVGIEGSVGANFKYRDGSIDLHNYDPSNCTAVPDWTHSEVAPEGYSFLGIKGVKNKSDARRLLAVFRNYFSGPDLREVDISPSELAVLDKEVLSRVK